MQKNKFDSGVCHIAAILFQSKYNHIPKWQMIDSWVYYFNYHQTENINKFQNLYEILFIRLILPELWEIEIRNFTSNIFECHHILQWCPMEHWASPITGNSTVFFFNNSYRFTSKITPGSVLLGLGDIPFGTASNAEGIPWHDIIINIMFAISTTLFSVTTLHM